MFRSHASRLLPLLALTSCVTRPSSTPPTTSAPVTLAAAANPAWYEHAVFYEVFVRSFQDSNGDGQGDLPGLISRLDYLNDGDPSTTTDLGVDALWLMPVFASPSYHGYDITDYETIQPAYGTNDDFTRLCTEAHRRGMRVIVDLVLNHSSDQHPWFVDSASSPDSSKRDWYVWSATDPGWTQPWNIFSSGSTWHLRNGAYYYGVFWGGMPDLNLRTSAVRAELERVAALWLARGADGFRLDAARYLIETGPGLKGQADTAETHAFLKEFAAFVRGVKPDAALVGEAWTDTPVIAPYYGSTAQVPGGDELPLNFNFPLADALVKTAQSADSQGVALKLSEMSTRYPAGASDAPFLTNHDQVRVATQLAGKSGPLTTAASLLLTLPGSPFIYYGEELGMANGTTGNDEAKRTPMPWDTSAGGGFTTGTPWYAFSPGHDTTAVSTETNTPGSLLSRYRALIHARHASPALERGGLVLLTSTQVHSPTLAFVRTLDTERVLVVHNLGDSSEQAGPFTLEGESAEALYTDSGVGAPVRGEGTWSVTLPPRTTGLWRLR